MFKAIKLFIYLIIFLCVHDANAHTVYKKDNVSLDLDLRVNASFLSLNYNHSSNKHSTLRTSGRFGIGGKSKISDNLTLFGYMQWGYSPTSKKNGLRTREQYVGLDFNKYGSIKIGRFTDASNYAENVTEHWVNAGETSQGRYKGKRRNSQITYILSNNPYYLRLGVQFAEDNAHMISFDTRHQKLYDEDDNYLGFTDKWAIDSGFNFALGYNLKKLWGKPLTIRLGYNYLKGQEHDSDFVFVGNNKKSQTGYFDNDNIIRYTQNGNVFENFSHLTFGIGYGDVSDGLYIAAMSETSTLKNPLMITDSEIKMDGFELLISYAFSNGISTRIGYEATFWTWNFKDTKIKDKFQFRRIPLLIEYKHNANFTIFAECGFNAGSSHYYYGDKDFPVDRNRDKFVWSAGGRFEF